MANIRETLIGWGFGKQTDIATANVLAEIWRLGKLNAELNTPLLNTENDAEELGKGHEFPTALFKSHYDLAGRIEKYMSSDFAAWVMVFGLGASIKTGTPPNLTYTVTPADPVVDGIELAYFSYLEHIRPGGSDVLDRMAVGCMVSGFTLTVGSGPGRANSKLVADFVGSGKLTEPSGIVMPASTVEKLLPSSSLTLTINGVDYVTNKNIVGLELTWQNNPRLDAGFFPGSGSQDAAAIRGRIEYGDRVLGFKFTARFVDGSTEFTTLKNLTEGTAVLVLNFDVNNDLTITVHRNTFSVVELGNTDGIVTVEVTCMPLFHVTNGLITAVAKCNTDLIG